MGETMQAAYFVEIGRVEMREQTKPAPGPGEVLVQVKAIGICGSDMTLFRHGGLGTNVVKQPMVMGHEASGVIAGVGPGVTRWKPGDRVVMEPGIPCRRCALCKAGRYHLCLDVKFSGVPPTNGFMAEFVTMPEDFVYPMPESMDFARGTLIEPLAVGLMACSDSDVQIGHSVGIFGSGPIGLTTLVSAQARGATQTFVVDVVASRLKVAKEMGATEVINPRDGDAVERIMELTGGRGVDRALETAGAPATTQMAVKAVARGGTVGLVGVVHQPEVGIDVVRVVRSNIRVQGVFRYANQYPAAVDVVRAGKVDLSRLVTHTWPLRDVQEALQFVETNKDSVIKGVLTL